MLRRSATAGAGQTFDSLDVEADQRCVARGSVPAQIHRELVVFDEDQVYPEFVVWYRLEEQMLAATSMRIADMQRSIAQQLTSIAT